MSSKSLPGQNVTRLPTADQPPIVQPNPTHCSACGRKLRRKLRRGRARWLNHERGCERQGLWPDLEKAS